MAALERTERGAYISLGVMVGLAAGAIAGLLLAPQSGTESREQLRRKQRELKDRAVAEIEKKRQMAADKLDEVSQKAKRASDKRKNDSDSDNDMTIM